MAECLYTCKCGSFRWIPLPDTSTMPTPICHGSMQPTHQFREQKQQRAAAQAEIDRQVQIGINREAGLIERAERAEAELKEEKARADKFQSAYAKEFDIRNGTPCEQIRWQQTLDDTRENLANVQVQLDDCGALARRLTYALKRSHTNEELCKQSVDLLKRLGQGGQIVRAK